jgi:glycosyltransferase involved in cell wall biosynthesis
MNESLDHKKRVAILSPYQGVIGEARAMPSLARGLASHGHQVELLRVWDEWEDADLGPDSNPVQVTDLGTRRFVPFMPDITSVSSWANWRLKMGLWSLGMMPGLVSYLRREQPDVLIARLLTMPAVIGKMLAKSPTRLIISMSGLPRHSTYRDFLWPRVHTHADGFVAPAESVARYSADMIGIPRERFHIIPNPVLDDETLERAEEPVDHPWFNVPEHPVVIAVGRLTRQKDFPTLFRAFARVREQIPARLMILGEGEDRADLTRLASELDLTPDLFMPGHVLSPLGYMKAADVFVMSSEWEGPGHVLIEAQAVGTPAVSTDCPAGPRETLLNGEAGMLVPVGDEVAMATAITKMLMDRETALTMAGMGLEHIDRFYPANVASKWSALIEGTESPAVNQV